MALDEGNPVGKHSFVRRDRVLDHIPEVERFFMEGRFLRNFEEFFRDSSKILDFFDDVGCLFVKGFFKIRLLIIEDS